MPDSRSAPASAGHRAGSVDAKALPPSLSDLDMLRRRARERIEQGAVTSGYRANREVVVDLLNAALATELVCVLRYKRHAFTAKGIHAEPVVEEFRQHALEEAEHADLLAERIMQLGGAPNFSPDGLSSRAHSEYDESTELIDMIREDLVAERIAIETYAEMVRYIGDDDATTRRVLEGILQKEEEHADDLATMLANLAPPKA
jgi:bacterioferritin